MMRMRDRSGEGGKGSEEKAGKKRNEKGKGEHYDLPEPCLKILFLPWRES